MSLSHTWKVVLRAVSIYGAGGVHERTLIEVMSDSPQGQDRVKSALRQMFFHAPSYIENLPGDRVRVTEAGKGALDDAK